MQHTQPAQLGETSHWLVVVVLAETFWDIFIVGFAVTAAIFFVRDVFYSKTLLCMPPKIIQILRQSDLITPLVYDVAEDLHVF